MIPYGKQSIDDEDIKAVMEVLTSDWLTTGPKVSEFEQKFSSVAGSKESVVVSNGTAALHTAMYALGIHKGDEVIVPSMTFAASANCVVFQGAKPVIVDVDTDTLLIDPEKVEKHITAQTKAIVTVDYAGQPCDYDHLWEIAEKYQLPIVADACHSLGGRYKNRPVGSLATLNTFSFHPVKHITTGEGGMITTDDPELARRMRLFRNHGISTDHRQREEAGSWFYEMIDLGYNYRLTDIQCALGISQLKHLPDWILRRQKIAHEYDRAFAAIPEISPLGMSKDVSHAYHLYVIRLNLDMIKTDRATIFRALRQAGIGVNVHYIPVHMHPFYQKNFGTRKGDCPVAESAYERIITLPMYPKMNEDDIDTVINTVENIIRTYS